MAMQHDGLNGRLHGLLLVILAGAWMAGIFIASLSNIPPAFLLAGAALTLIPLVFSYRHYPVFPLLLILCILLLGAWRYSSAAPQADPQAISAFIGKNTLKIRGTVDEEPRFNGHSRTLNISVDSVNAGKQWQKAHGKIELQIPGTTLEDPYGANYGDGIEITGKLQSVFPHGPPDILASMAFPRVHIVSHGGNPMLAYLYHLRNVLAAIIAQALPQPAAALLIAIVLGLRTPALKELATAFNVTGTAHLIVPSGFKVTILAGLVSQSMRWIHGNSSKVKKLPAQRRHSWQSWLVSGLVLLCIAAYTVLSGAGPAAIRAGIMGSLLAIAPRLGRRYNVYPSLAMSALIMSLLDPFVLWDVGFQLSFLGTLGIVLLTPYFQRWLRGLEHLPGGTILAENIAVTMAAQIATLPIFAIAFQEISLIAPIANLLSVPLLATLILLGIMLCIGGAIYAPLGLACGWLAFPLLWYAIQAITFCANLPGAYITIDSIGPLLAWLYYAALSIVVYLLLTTTALPTPHTSHKPGTQTARYGWRLVQAGAALFVILGTGAATLTAQPPRQISVTFLAVGPPNQPQGEAVLIRTPDNKTLLIDGGPDQASLAHLLDSRLPSWQRSLDIVLLTAPLRDHITGLFDIVTRYTIGTIIDAGMLHPGATYAAWRRIIDERKLHYLSVTAGITIPVGQVTLQVLWPTSQLHKGSDEARDNGLVVRLLAPGLRVLFLGEGAQSKYALSRLISTPANLQAEIVQIVGTSGKPSPPELQALLQLIRPSLLVITPAALRSEQHVPAPAPNDALATSDWQTIQVAQQGTIEINGNAPF